MYLDARGYAWGYVPCCPGLHLRLCTFLPRATPEAMYLITPGHAWGYVSWCPGLNFKYIMYNAAINLFGNNYYYVYSITFSTYCNYLKKFILQIIYIMILFKLQYI